MKKGLVLLIGLIAVLFLFSSVEDSYARRFKRSDRRSKRFASKKDNDRKILKNMRSRNPRIAIPAIQNVQRNLRNPRSIKQAKRILTRIVGNKRKSPRIRIAAANKLADMRVKRAVPILRRAVRKERNRKVRFALKRALNRLTGHTGKRPYKGKRHFRGSPKYYGTPGYKGSPKYYGTPGYKGTPGYYGSPGY